ncbi:MAG TPA: hypothetical protein VHZ73_02390 [Vicinamibacterales bacterium]|jgi:hypothetical protein|nr:hypothetical protein [Vicinamibacterales bacterium]
MSAPTIARTAITDDSGSGADGTVLDNAWKQELYDQIDDLAAAVEAGVPTPTVPGTSAVATTGNITALALPSGDGPLVIRMTNASLATIQGIAAGIDGQELTLIAQGAGQVDLSHNNGSGTALGKLRNILTSMATSLSPGVGIAKFIYDLTNTRWNLVGHVQGAAIDYTASSTIVGWSSFTSGRKFIKYTVTGRQILVQWQLEGTSNATAVSMTLPFTADGAGSFPSYYNPNGFTYDNGAATSTTGAAVIAPAASTINVFVNNAEAGWTGSGTKVCAGQMVLLAA